MKLAPVVQVSHTTPLEDKFSENSSGFRGVRMNDAQRQDIMTKYRLKETAGVCNLSKTLSWRGHYNPTVTGLLCHSEHY